MSKIRIEKVGITDAGTDCIVNAANEHLQGGSGVCGAIFRAAGWDELQAACDKIGHCDTGSAVITPAFRLNAKHIVHAVGPIWQGGRNKESQKLYGCYKASLRLAMENDCHSIAFPLISAGIFGYPKDKAWRKALQACNDYIAQNPDYEMDILFTVLDESILKLGQEELQRQRDEKAIDPQVSVDNTPLEIPSSQCKKQPDSIVFFFRENEEFGCFSNFYHCDFDYAGRHYTSSEQYMMAQKALAFWDVDMCQRILETDDPKKAKALGREVKGYDDAIWDTIRPQIVRRGVRAKFQQNEDLRKLLLGTGDKILVEASPYDALWGIKMGADNPSATNPANWKGQNLLGNVLMRVRADLRSWVQSGDFHYVDAEVDRLSKPADSIWNIPIRVLVQNPIAHEIIYPFILCADHITKKSLPDFDFIKRCGEATLAGVYIEMATNMGGGLPCSGFYEMCQDLFDAVRFGCI